MTEELADRHEGRPVVSTELAMHGMVWDVVRDRIDLGDAGEVVREYVRHPGAVAVAARALGKLCPHPVLLDELFVAGLIHDVGALVERQAYPEEFTEVIHRCMDGGTNFLECEREVVGVPALHYVQRSPGAERAHGRSGRGVRRQDSRRCVHHPARDAVVHSERVSPCPVGSRRDRRRPVHAGRRRGGLVRVADQGHGLGRAPAGDHPPLHR